MIREIQLMKVTGFASFIAFSGYTLFLTLATPFQLAMAIGVSIAAALYVVSLRLERFRLISLSWFLVGVELVVSWTLYGPLVNYMTLFLWVVVLIASFQLSRLATIVAPMQSRNFGRGSVVKLRQVIRHCLLITLLFVSVSYLSSIIITELSTGLLLPASPMFGLAIFAPLTIIVIAIIPLQIERKP